MDGFIASLPTNKNGMLNQEEKMELKFEITEELGILSENEKGWRKELNLVSWNEREP